MVGGRTVVVLWYVASRICSIQLVALSCNCRQAFSRSAYSAYMWCIHIIVWTRPIYIYIYACLQFDYLPTGDNWSLFCCSFNHVYETILHRHHHHYAVQPARISLTLSRHFSLSFIASGRSSRLHPISSHSCCICVQASRPAIAQLYVGVHRSTSHMSSSLLLQQCPACLGSLTWIVFVMGGHVVGILWGVAARTCSILLATFLCNCRIASSPAV